MLERKSDGEILSLLLVKEPSVRVLKLLRGEIDLLQQVPRDLHPMLMLQGLVPLLRLPEEETLGEGLDAEPTALGSNPASFLMYIPNI